MPTTVNKGAQWKSSAQQAQPLSNACIQPELFFLAGPIDGSCEKKWVNCLQLKPAIHSIVFDLLLTRKKTYAIYLISY
jgi:hypothetical protein